MSHQSRNSVVCFHMSCLIPLIHVGIGIFAFKCETLKSILITGDYFYWFLTFSNTHFIERLFDDGSHHLSKLESVCFSNCAVCLFRIPPSVTLQLETYLIIVRHEQKNLESLNLLSTTGTTSKLNFNILSTVVNDTNCFISSLVRSKPNDYGRCNLLKRYSGYNFVNSHTKFIIV